ncbi:MAG: AAA family ATPase [bacterium]
MLESDKRLVELHHLACEKGSKYQRRRDFFDLVRQQSGKHFTAIVGPRGVGKTVVLQQLAALDEEAFYLSSDTLGGQDLFEVVKRLVQRYGARSFLIDEIHFAADYPAALKRMYDFLDVRVVFTSSVSLSLLASAQDLSRRVRTLYLRPFSFREYLVFTRDQELPQLTLDDIVGRRWSQEHLLAEPWFSHYLQGGLMPFALEEPDVPVLLEAILDRIVNRDIPAVARLLVEELGLIRQLLRFIGRAQVDGINYSSLSRNIGITKYKAEAYVGLLERSFVLTRTLPAGTNVMREPKVLMSVPYRLLYRELEDAIGGLREDFVVGMLQAAAFEVDYLKSTRGGKTPDYLVRTPEGELVIEVGGKGKGRTQFKGVSVERKIILSDGGGPQGSRRPLHLLGFIA